MASFTEAVRLSGAIDHLPRAYVRCTGELDTDADLLDLFAARARAEGWLYRELETAHDLQLTDPDGTIAILDDLALAAARAAPSSHAAGLN